MEIDREYIMRQSSYRKMNNNRENIFPNEWYFVKAYDLKKSILKECLLKNILIINSRDYLLFRKKALDKKG